MENMDFVQEAKIKVIGVGGGGCNAVSRMVKEKVAGVEFYVANTDAQMLKGIEGANRIVIGKELTHGLGAGGNPEVGKKAAQEAEAELRECIQGADMVFIATGMGGGTGTGASPVIAKIARELDALTVAVVTTPFSFEGPRRLRNAEEGLAQLRENVDSIITVSNNNLLEVIGTKAMSEAFQEADNVLRQAVQTITELIAVPAYINLDFADVKSIMKDRGNALIGIGIADKGDDKAETAAKNAVNSPLLSVSIKGAKDAIVNVTGGSEITLQDASNALATIKEVVGNEVNTILGVAINEQLGDQIIVTVIATGFDEKEEETPVVQPFKTKEDIKNDESDDEEIPNFLRNRRF